MKGGARALGVAESFAGDDERSVLCGAVVRADRVVDGVGFGSCSVGGTDATEAVAALWDEMGREDAHWLFLSGIAPAWFNVVDLHALSAATDRPVLSLSFESSPGLEPALREAFAGDVLDRRLSTYRDQPPRRRLDVNGEAVYVRAVGVDGDRAADVVRAFTPEGGRPEPLRVARLGARAARRFRDDDEGEGEGEGDGEA